MTFALSPPRRDSRSNRPLDLDSRWWSTPIRVSRAPPVIPTASSLRLLRAFATHARTHAVPAHSSSPSLFVLTCFPQRRLRRSIRASLLNPHAGLVVVYVGTSIRSLRTSCVRVSSIRWKKCRRVSDARILL